MTATMLSAEQIPQSSSTPREIEVPAPTAWPLVLAFGFTLLFAGLVTSVSVSILGAVLSVAGWGGWVRGGFPPPRGERGGLAPEGFLVKTARGGGGRGPAAGRGGRGWGSRRAL